MNQDTKRISISLAKDHDRKSIYAIRHQVYAVELGQHDVNEAEKLTDRLDAVNTYIVAKAENRIVGFVSVTPPNKLGYSIDKYFVRKELPFVFDQSLYEIRLLTVIKEWRGSFLAGILMKAAHNFVKSLGGTIIVAIGRLEVLKLYLQVGLKSLGRQVKSGKVTYELLTARVDDLIPYSPQLQKASIYIENRVTWNIEFSIPGKINSCYHGGDFFDAIGEEFETLDLRYEVINADVLDAWFDPAPNVIKALSSSLPWILKTSPPTGNEGMCRMLARSRGVLNSNIVAGAGSSDLIFLGLRHWIKSDSRVLILDPMYGEYAHVLEKVVKCKVDRLTLSRETNYKVQMEELSDCIQRAYDWVILVNPNSPTGQYIPKEELEILLKFAPEKTNFWIDETYLEYVAQAESLEQYSSASKNVIICKSLSKIFALSGARCAYLCGPSHHMDELRLISPPWAVSLPGQIAVCEALRNLDYYHERWAETCKLREELALGLSRLGWEVLPGCANFLLCHLPSDQIEASVFISACRRHGLFLRDVVNMGQCFDNHTLRIAVKDAKTNFKMLSILQKSLSEFTLRSADVPIPGLG
jgi:histidinol-phosphate/aromatic aminotransferase/cobyric acid decarboxylase-like protein